MDATSVVPTNLLVGTTFAGGDLTFGPLDLSQFSGARTLVPAFALSSRKVIFKRCKLASGVTIAQARADSADARVYVLNCADGDDNTRDEVHAYEAVETTESTIVRTGGQSNGTNATSRKVVTGSGTNDRVPYVMEPLYVWNDTVGSPIVVTVEGVWNSVTAPTNLEAWLEAEYQGTPGYPLGLIASGGAATPATSATAGTSSAVTWTTTGLATPGAFKLELEFTPEEIGHIAVFPHFGKASSTFYVEAKVTKAAA